MYLCPITDWSAHNTCNDSQHFRELRFPVVLNFHRECYNPVKKHSKASMFFAASKSIPIVYSADRGSSRNQDKIFCWLVDVLFIQNEKIKLNPIETIIGA